MMFDITPMLGGTALLAIRWAFIGIVLWNAWKIVEKLLIKEQEFKTAKINVIVGGIMIAVMALFGGSRAPKITINTPPSYELKQYQNNNEEIIINTPEERTQTLDGFKPLSGNSLLEDAGITN